MNKRFTTEKQITDQMDKYHNEMLTLCQSADNLDKQADGFRNTESAWQIENVREVATNMRKRAHWRELRIAKLGQLLAEFRTGVLEVVTTDGSVKGLE